ncbi:MAG: PqiC family protein [Verrucomicrobiota bacterium]
MKIHTILLVIPCILSSCGSMLEPVKDTSVHHMLESTIPHRGITGSSPAVAISRPSLPSYLDREQLVSRSDGGTLQMNNYHLWAEPLNAGISRVMAINLGRLTNSLNIQPVESFVTLDYQKLLEIRISRFEADASNNIVLECTWKLQPVTGRVADTRTFQTMVPVSAADSAITSAALAGRVSAMNEALARLSRVIARSL